jgi:oligopeptide/dipeptide ABC transporter ATP-binding protein
VIMSGFVLIAISLIIKFFIHSDKREHDKFMRFIRGNEISMIFQEPMTALNPLYTVEKQIFEVMKTHKRLSKSSVSKSTKFISSLKSPIITSYNWVLYDRFSAALFSSLLLFYLLVSCMGPDLISSWGTQIAMIFYASAEVSLSCQNYSDDIIIYSFLLIPLGVVRSSIIGDSFSSVLRTIPFTFTLSLTYAIILWTPNPVVGTLIGLFLVIAIPLIIIVDFLQLDPAHRNQVIKILEDVQIPNPSAVITMYPHELSGGMRQRVMIAMMMSCEPKLLIADEPTTALDVTIQAQILHLMRDLRDRKGTSIMLITHDLGVIAELCDSVSVMYAGSVVETGTIEDILTNPRMPYTIGLLHSIPKIVHSDKRGERTSLPIIPGQVPDPNTHFEGCRFHPRCPFADDLCRSIRPDMIEVNEGHFAACHYTERTINSKDVESSFDEFSKEFEGVGGEVVVR